MDKPAIGETIHSSRYLSFVLAERLPKTQVYHVYSKTTHAYLAEIRWFATWRQYTFFPEPETIWNAGCLEDIVSFINNLAAERKGEKK